MDVATKKKRLVLVSNTSWSLWNFRLELMRTLRESGFDVVTVAPKDDYSQYLEREFRHYNLRNLDRKGANLFKDFKLFIEFIKLYGKIEPDLVINFTIKPNIYSSIAAKLLGIPSISVLSGLGYVFLRKSFLKNLVKALYWAAFKCNKYVVFLNKHDLQELKDITGTKGIVIPGEGINPSFFSPNICKREEKKKFIFLFIGRFLKDKGIVELIEASKKLYNNNKNFQLWLLGGVDRGNPASLKESDLEELRKLPFVKILPFTRDVRPYICSSDCVVLPSYREGLSRTLLEAMSMEKPIITTNVPGCKDLCFDGLNGFVVKPRDSEELYLVLKKMVELTPEKRMFMGKSGRKLILEKFSKQVVLKQYIELIEGALHYK